jgi:hypothetical protein
MNKNTKLDQLVELAMETEITDPIDWDMLSISEENAYKMMALHVLEMFDNKKDDKYFDIIVMSTMTKLLVENFVLNLKLKEKNNG